MNTGQVKQILDTLIKDLQERENECYRQIAYMQKNKFNIEGEAIRYAQQAYKRSWLEVADARDKIVKLMK